MSQVYAKSLTPMEYELAAIQYQRGLPMEHYMEATSQSTQREITVESLALLRTFRRDVQYFNELLVQYLVEGRLRQVVPDNMIVVSNELIVAVSSYNIEHQPAAPFMVFEYVSRSNPRKDYDESFHKYERELSVPYCLLFRPDQQDLRVYRHDGTAYQRLAPAANGRLAVTELELEAALVDGWVRYWYQGRRLELPAELAADRAQLGKRLLEQARAFEALEHRFEVQESQLESIREALAARNESLKEKDATIGSLASDLEERTNALRLAVEILRTRVAERARAQGRSDILAQLAATDDIRQLNAWLSGLD